MPTRALLLALALAFLPGCERTASVPAARAQVGDTPVVLLSTSRCGYCRKLRADLENWNVAYVDYDIERDPAGRRAFDAVHGRGVPVLLIGERSIHGYAPQRTQQWLNDAGLLDSANSIPLPDPRG